MAWLLDSDLLVFVYTLVSVLLKSPAALRAGAQTRRMPVVFQFQQLSPAELSEGQRKFFEPYDEKLAAMQYFPVCTYRVANFGHNLVRRYLNAADPASCSVLAVEVKVKTSGVVAMAHSSLLEFTTRFAGGSRLTTRNMKHKTLMDQPPGRLVQECPTVSDPAALKKRHDARCAQLGAPQPPEMNVQRGFETLQREHQSFMDYQVERGLYRREADGCYVESGKLHWRGIRNHFNPFVHRFSPLQFAAALVLAVGIPSLAHWKAAWVMAALPPTGLPAAALEDLVLLAGYLLAGAAVGLLLQRSTFLWTFLLTYLGVHALTGWWTSGIPFSGLAALAAYSTAQMAKRRKLILLPEAKASGDRAIG